MLFYITYRNLMSSGHAGIRKKVVAQAKVFDKRLGTTYYTYWCFETAYLMHGEEVIEKAVALDRKEFTDVLIRWIEKYQVSQTYIRYPMADHCFIKLLQYQKEHQIKTMVEIPTFPYDEEMSYSRRTVEDRYYRRFVSEYVDIYSVYSYDNDIWGKPTISLWNGIDIDECKMAQKNKQDDTISMIATAGEFCRWNGFERIIEGLWEYKQKNDKVKCKLYLVGKGGDEISYRTLVKKYGLEENVIFTGWLNRKELDEVFDLADIAIGTLALFKLGLESSCAIKGAEYCAKGLPMVFGYDDARFPKDTEFILRVPNDSSPLNIEEVINFYQKVSLKKNYNQTIRKYAEEHISWDSIMRPVVEYYLER